MTGYEQSVWAGVEDCWSEVEDKQATLLFNEEDAFIRLSGATDLPSDALGGWASYL